MKASQIIPLTENVELGDSFDIELGNMVVHTGVVGLTTDGVILEADEKTMALLGISGALFESVDSPMVIEGSMDEADALLQDIARGQEDIFRVKDDPEGPVERYVADLLKEKFESVAFDNELDSRKDSAQIAELVRIDLADDVLDTPDQDQPVSLNLNKTSRPIHEQGVAEEHNDTFDPKSHQYKTTMKHADRPTVQQRMAAHDIKPGIAGYRDRIDLLKDLERTGKLKKKGVAEGLADDSINNGYSLKLVNREKKLHKGGHDPDSGRSWSDEYEIQIKYDIIKNETNEVVGEATWNNSGDYPSFRHLLKVSMRDGEFILKKQIDTSKFYYGKPTQKGIDKAFSKLLSTKKQGMAEGKPDQLPTRGADYSQYDTDHLRTLLKPGILHRNEAKFKALIRKELRKREQQGVAEGFPHDVDHMPGPTKKYSNTNCTICHGRKYMYKLDGKLFADNRKDAVKVKCPTCKGTGDKQGVKEGYSDISGLLAASKLYRSFIITAELAEGGTKKFRVKAQSERTAVEKFKQHHSMAKIVNVKEEHNETQDLSPGVRETRIRDRIKSLQNLISIYKDKGDKAKVKELTSELDSIMRKSLDEAEYQGRKVPLGKPMQGDVKKSKVYVKGPNGNVVKVNFGDKNMKIKKSNPKRRKSFRARHNCDNPGPRWRARYWSCRAW